MREMAIGLVVSALALAGCSKPAPSNVADAGANTAAATPAAATPVAAGPAGAVTLAELPAPTKGNWQRVGSQDGGPPDTSTKCLDGKPINPLDGLPMQCPKVELTRTATGGFTMDADCPNNGVDAKLHMTGEGDFAKTFTTDGTMTMTGGPGPAQVTKNHSVWTYVGPACAKAG